MVTGMRVARLTLTVALAALAAIACGSSSSSTSNTWRRVSDTPGSRFEAWAGCDGARVWYVGGILDDSPAQDDPKPSAHVDVLQVGTNRWSRAADLPDDAPKHHLTATLFSGKLWVLSGFDGILGGSMPFIPKATAYVLEAGAWRRLRDAPTARGGATVQAIGGKLYVAGGAPTEEAPSIAALDVYDPQTDTWSQRAPLPTPREHVASCVVGGRFVVIGGWNQKREVQAVVEAYDPATDQWTRLPDLPTARGGLGAVNVGERCYAIGGETWATPPPATFGAAEMLDPQTGRWAPLAPMPTPRHGLGLAVVGGEVWALGGGPRQGNSYTTVIEAYRP